MTGLVTIIVGYAQEYKYSYVRDDDMYVNVRNSPNAKAKVVDTLYNLQIVQIDTEEKEVNGWVKITISSMNRNYVGYINKSRLRDIPAEYTANLDSIWNGWDDEKEGLYWSGHFYITSVDCPEIVAVVASSFDTTQIKEYNDDYNTGWYRGHYRVVIPSDGVAIRNLRTGKVMEYFDIFYPISLTIYPSKLIFSSADFMYSYYQNRDNKTCRGLTFLNAGDIIKLSFQEQTNVLDIARKAYEATKQLNAQNQKEYYEINDKLGKIIGLNNFEYWTKLEWMYFNGNVEAQKLYPYLLPYFPKDGEGSNVIDDYLDRKWAYENRGEVEIK